MDRTGNFDKKDGEHGLSRFPDGTIIHHYRIVRRLGGSVGDVYMADDTRLERPVVLKFLPVHLLRNEEARTRLIDEARAASRLNHPGIVAIYTVEEADDRVFIVMEFVEGESLKEHISNKDLTSPQILDIAFQIGEGLEAAHLARIVHRDIKSANIIVTSASRAKILDFGLALSGATKTSAEGSSTSGTLAYMSPEQARGGEVDHRSDIFSFGVVIYEMITGRLPFTGEYEASLIYSILNDTPEAPGRYRSDLPGGLESIISKALEKDPARRYQDISELLSDLKRVSADAAGSKDAAKKRRQRIIVGALAAVFLAVAAMITFTIIPGINGGGQRTKGTIAVLPFENMGERADTIFAGAVAAEITSQLTKVGGLSVIARSSAMQYEKSGKNAVEFASGLQADYVLEGTVYWDKKEQTSRVMITPNLVRVRDGTQIWSESYEEVLDEIFVVLAGIAVRVTDDMNIALLERERLYVQRTPTENMAAYEKFMRGGYYFGRSWGRQDIELAIEMYLGAVGLDPDFALAHAWLSNAHSTMYREFYDRSENRIRQAKAGADRALQLEPDLPDGHLALGMYYYSLMMPDSALHELTVARRSQPNNSEIYAAIAGVQRRRGEIGQAIENYLKAFSLDPLSPLKAFDVSYSYGLVRQYAQARAYLDRAMSIAPDWPLPYIYKAWLYLFAEGSKQEAAAVMREASRKVDLSQTEYREYYWWLSRILDDDPAVTLERITPGMDSVSYFLHRARIYGILQKQTLKTGYSDSARVILAPLVESYPDEPRFHSQLGLAYAGLGRDREAISEGRRAVALLEKSEEATNAQFWVANLAEIYMLTGDYDSAVESLRMLLAIPGFASLQYLMIDPLWAPLGDHPGFKKLIASQDEGGSR